jgi:hypothetical protein
MALNQTQREHLENHLETVATKACQMCGATDWEPDDRSLYLSDDPTRMGMFAARVVPVTCGTCHQIVLFSGRAIGA